MHGLVYVSDPSAEWSNHVPCTLLSVQARATIKHLSASIKLIQTYKNDSKTTRECSYVFPIPDRAAVNGFVMVKQNGTRIVGAVKEKEEAKKDYEEAKEQGKMTSLLLQETPDTFQMLVGNILPQEQVTIELEYVTELTEDERNDSISLHLPFHIGARYGAEQPESISTSLSSTSTSQSFFQLETSIEAVSPIKQITCPSHTISTELGPAPEIASRVQSTEHSHHARISFSSPTSLDKDFVLSIVASSYDSPRCMSEIHPTRQSTALALSLVPKFNLPELEDQEYLFLVDRSGSMGGDRMDMAKKALVVMLRSLPSRKGTEFNIISFGSSSQANWKSGSRGYDQRSLTEATKLVDSMSANFGGTEMNAALDATFSLRNQAKASAVFVLTDGDAWDLDNVYTTVRNAVAKAKAQAPLRVFVLGIGNSASTAMCEGIARVGNGTCQFVVDGESFTGKTTRLLKAAKSQPFAEVTIDYGKTEASTANSNEMEATSDKDEDDFEMVETTIHSSSSTVAEKVCSKPAMSLFDSTVDPLDASSAATTAPSVAPVHLADLPPIQQAPKTIQSLYSGSRLNVYAILNDRATPPEEVTIHAKTQDGQSFELVIPVTHSSSRATTIHEMSAKKLIQALEDDKTSSSARTNEEERRTEAEIVRLGTMYQLVSSKTSFVAVDESASEDEMRQRRAAIHKPMARVLPNLRGGGGPGGMARSMMCFAAAAPAPPPPGGGSFMFGRAAPKMSTMSYGAPAPSSAPAPMASRCVPPPACRPQVKMRKMMSCSGPTGPDGISYMTAPAAPFESSEQASLETSKVDQFDSIARAQLFDGSFESNVINSIGVAKSQINAIMDKTKCSEDVTTALLVLSFWKVKMGEREEEWEGLAEKAQSYVRQELKIDQQRLEELINQVQFVVS